MPLPVGGFEGDLSKVVAKGFCDDFAVLEKGEGVLIYDSGHDMVHVLEDTSLEESHLASLTQSA